MIDWVFGRGDNTFDSRCFPLALDLRADQAVAGSKTFQEVWWSDREAARSEDTD
jgi:hypothetical protein